MAWTLRKSRVGCRPGDATLRALTTLRLADTRRRANSPF
jgi:hypothetical protein